MEPPSVMDKKAALRVAQVPNKSGTDPPAKEYGSKKSVPQHGRKKEWERGGGGGSGSGGGGGGMVESGGKRGGYGRGGRAPSRFVRPREKTGGKVESYGVQPESGSLLIGGGGKKRQNITHLLDWWGPSAGHHRSRGHGSSRQPTTGSARVRHYSSHTPKYTKEHYLQANCQFVVGDLGDYSKYWGNQDLLVDWNLVEEVRLHVGSAPACPICLHPPTAAKVTRCGHIYCFPCILHYLALSDKKWRTCPICYEPVDKKELKSVMAVCHGDFTLGEKVELQLMRRERDSLLPVPASAYTPDLIAAHPRITHPSPATPYTKLILASRQEVQSHIVAREQRELEEQLSVEGDQPESCFIHEALQLLLTRQATLNSLDTAKKVLTGLEGSLNDLSLSSPDEPISSSGSFSSFDDPLSPLSPTTFGPLSPLLSTLSPLKQPSAAHNPFNLPENWLSSDDKTTSGEVAKKESDGDTKNFEAATVDANADGDMCCGGEGGAVGGNDEGCVTVEDLDISQLQPDNVNTATNATATGGQRPTPKATFYFYQASNGAHVYLHSLNIQMLVQQYGALENCPPLVSARVVEKVTGSMTEDLRSRLRYLRHLPLTSSFELLEVALVPPILSTNTLALFQEKIEARQRSRNRRAREERKIEKRVRAEEDRMLGRSKGATNLKIESFKQFPSFAEDFPPGVDGVGVDGAGGVSVVPNDNSGGGEVDNSNSIDGDPMTATLPATSPPDTSTGISFAKMIREGQTRPSVTPRTSSGGAAWPSLGGASPRSGYGGYVKLGGVVVSEDEVDEEGAAAAPEFKHAFSAAVARALDAAATRKTTGPAEGEEGSNGGGRRGKNKKKKKKQVVLFSSGGFG